MHVNVQRPKPALVGVGYGEVGRLGSAAATEDDLPSHERFCGCLGAVQGLSKRTNLAFPCLQH